MKRKYLLLLSAVVICVMATLFLLFRKSDSDYLCALPRTQVLCRLDVPELLRSSGLSEKDLSALFREKGIVGTAGLDLTRPVYGFLSEEGFSGFLFAVDDKGELVDVFRRLNLRVELRHGINWAMNESWLIACDGGRGMVIHLESSAQQERLYRFVEAHIRQKIFDKETVEKLQSIDGPVRLCCRTVLLARNSLLPFFKDYLPQMNEIPDADLLASLSVGVQSLSLRILLSSEQATETFATVDSVFQPIRALPSIMVQEPVFWCSMGVHGARLLQVLRTNPALRLSLLALNMMVDADMMLRSVEGDVVFCVPDYSVDSPLLFQRVLCTAQLKDKTFLEHAGDWEQSFSGVSQVKRYSQTDFSLRLSDVPDIYFGVRDSLLYLTGDNSLIQYVPPLSEMACDFVDTSVLRSCCLYATLDLSRIMPHLPVSLNLFGFPLEKHLSRFNFKVFDATTFEVELCFDKPLWRVR